MPLSRRELLLSAVGATAISLTSPANASTSTKTSIVFVNKLGSGKIVKIAASTASLQFDHTIQPSHSVTQSYSTSNKSGTKAPVEGNVTVVGLVTNDPISNVDPGLTVTYGKTNTFTLSVKNGTLHLATALS